MAPPIYAGLIRAEREGLVRANATDFAERDRAQKAGYAPEGLSRALAPINQRITARFNDAVSKSMTWAGQAKARYLKNLPESLERAAAALNPEKAAATLQVARAAGDSISELLALAMLAQEQQSPVLAWAVRSVLRGFEPTTTGIGDVVTALNAAAGESADNALADFVGAGVELGRLKGEGPFLDLGAQLVADPIAFLARAYSTGSIPTGDGQTVRSLSDAEIARLCDVAGVPQVVDRAGLVAA